MTSSLQMELHSLHRFTSQMPLCWHSSKYLTSSAMRFSFSGTAAECCGEEGGDMEGGREEGRGFCMTVSLVVCAQVV